MNSALISVGIFVVLLALAPLGLKWAQRRMTATGSGLGATSKIISAVAVGPHQRVVTVEVGPERSRVWLTLGVTAQSITCLHTAGVGSAPDADAPKAFNIEPTLS